MRGVPIEIRSWGIVTKGKDNDQLIIDGSLPVMLDARESHMLETPAAPLSNLRVKRICVWDTTDRMWRVAWWNRRQIMKRVRAAQAVS